MHTSTGWQLDLGNALELFGENPSACRAAARTLAEMPGHQLLKLDPLCRRAARLTASVDARYRREWRIPVAEGTDAVSAYLFHAGCDANGFRRQQAIIAAGQHLSPTTFALLLIRCADWVDPVRDTAESTLRESIEINPSMLFDQIELVARLLEHERFCMHAWPSIVTPALRSVEHAQARWRALDSCSGKTRLLIADQILAADPHRANELMLHCLNSKDPVAGRWALRILTEQLAQGAPEDIIDIALQHPNPGIRTQALRMCARNARPDLAELIVFQLTSPMFSLRNLAAHLAPNAGIDATRIWRDAVDDQSHAGRAFALASLSERAEAIDFDRIAPWTSHSSSEVRRHALAGLAKADIERSIPFLHNALTSASLKEVRDALKIGRLAEYFISRNTLATAYTGAPLHSTRLIILRAISLLWPWDQLDCLLDCLECTHGPRDSGLIEALSKWQGARIGKLDPARRQSLLTRLEQAQALTTIAGTPPAQTSKAKSLGMLIVSLFHAHHESSRQSNQIDWPRIKKILEDS